MNPLLKTRSGKSSSAQCRRSWRQRGFTLIELMIVITIILILIGMAAQRYERTITRSRESVLKSDLQVMRQSIEHYTLDKQNAPQSLDDLVQAGYLREIPIDPMTQQKDWQTNFGSTVLTPDQANTGIEDVHSNSDKNSPFDQTPYNQW